MKTTFLTLYLRVFANHPRPKYICYALLPLILGATAWGVFGLIFLCDPVQKFWDIGIEGTCKNGENHFLGTSILGIVFDWTIWILPMPTVRRLRLPRRQKLGLWAVFALGGVVCVVSILRLTLVRKAIHEGKVASKSSTSNSLRDTLIESRIWDVCAGLGGCRSQCSHHLCLIACDEAAVDEMDTRIGLTNVKINQRF